MAQAPNNPTRPIILSKEEIDKLLRECKRLDLKFVLFSGFQAGMRKEEIVMARPGWFNLSDKKIIIPDIEEYDGRIFKTASGRPRTIPLTNMFKEFLLNEYTEWQRQKYMIHPNDEEGIYRWEPRQAFETYMEEQGFRMPRDRKRCLSSSERMKIKHQWGNRPEVTFHAMRHSYCSHLLKDG